MWFKTGSITVTNGSTTVSGAGTTWISNAAIGEALYAPDGKLYEITNIASDTTMTIAPSYLGATASAQAYVIVPSQSYIRDLAAQAADLVNNYSTIYNTVGQGKFGDGTLGAPGIRFSDDLDTGFYRSASNEVTFVAGGTAIFKYNLTGGLSLTSGGDLVGTTATQTLTNKTLTSPTITGTGTAAFGNLSYTGTLTGGTGVINIGSGQVYKDASGNVGIGTSSPGTKLTVAGTSELFRMADATPYLSFYNAAQSTRFGYIQHTGTNLSLVNQQAGSLEMYTNNTLKATLDSSGNLLVGTTSQPNASFPGRFVVSGGGIKAASFQVNSTSATGQIEFYNPNGSVGLISTSGSTTTYSTSSDYRLKENVEPMTGALAKVAQLKPCTYTWKADGSAGQGFIAHELQTVVPDCVTGEKDAVDAEGNPKYQGVDTSFLVATLVAAIQELTAKVEALEAAA